jgi:hypothetical protein
VNAAAAEKRAAIESEKRRESDRDRVRDERERERERERESTTDARRLPTTEEGKRKEKFFEHETLWFHPGDCASSPT